MPVADLMTGPLVTIQHDTTVATAWAIMRDRQIRHLPVLDDRRRLIGMLTDHDLRRVVLQHLEGAGPVELRATLARLWVDEVMTWAVVTVTPERDIRDAARMMRDYEVGALVVVSEDRVVGILTATDVIEALLGSRRS